MLLMLSSCSNDSNRYQVINHESTTLRIIDTKDGIIKEFRDGKVYILDFQNNEIITEKLKGVKLAK